MNRIDALDTMKSLWNDRKMPLGKKAAALSEAFYTGSYDVAKVAEYIGATTTELTTLLDLGGRDDDVIAALSQTNPPIAAAMIMADAPDEDILTALSKYSNESQKESGMTPGEYVYRTLVEVMGPTVEANVSNLSASVITGAYEKAKGYQKTNKFIDKFLPSIARQKKMGKTLTERQISKLKEILAVLCEEGVFTRNSLDGDQELCDAILNALEM